MDGSTSVIPIGTIGGTWSLRRATLAVGDEALSRREVVAERILARTNRNIFDQEKETAVYFAEHFSFQKILRISNLET